MPSPDLILSFALAATLIELTPGPNMAYLAILSIEHGRRAGLSAVAGIALGLLGAGLAAALGLAALIEIFPPVYNVLRWAGVAYLLWLAWEGWRGSEGSPAEAGRFGWAKAVYFRRGLITNLLNPKAFLFYLAVLPRFIEPTRPLTSQTILLSLIYVAIATAIHAVIAILAGTAQRLTSVRSSRMIGRILSLALAGVAIWLAFATAR
jgi:threonine/homoserine/homoserine lactone efflux protein